MTAAWAPVRELLDQGLRDRVFGAASALVDRGGQIVFEARTAPSRPVSDRAAGG